MRKVHPNHRKVTPEKRHQLIQIFLHLGFAVSGRECVEAGVAPEYALREAKERGMHTHRRPRKSEGKSDCAVGVNHADPRWAWAIERGSIAI